MLIRFSFTNTKKTIKVVNTLPKKSGNKLMKGKALRKHSLHEKTAASVLLKLFISGNEKNATPLAPPSA